MSNFAPKSFIRLTCGGRNWLLIYPIPKFCNKFSACMTKTGKQCIFPFTFKNDTSPVLEYNVCSTLDVYKPWCPTSNAFRDSTRPAMLNGWPDNAVYVYGVKYGRNILIRFKSHCVSMLKQSIHA